MTAPAPAASFVPSHATPPPPAREFRGAWVATVKNIDWPSKPGLSTAQQKAELLIILDRAAQLKLNAVLLQVRPACDALYASKLEPWSEYLTGKMGRAPSPFYDPLEFAVTEAHRRGLELHAWFNPFRARHNTGFSTLSKNHISRTHPEFVRTYGQQLWLDPGDKAARDYSQAVILDIVKRYDIDGAHMDDYFYPYAEKDKAGAVIDFPDWPSWNRYLAGGGKLSRGDWRRENVNGFVHRLHDEIKARKPWVKFGISPFGIWRPDQPAGCAVWTPTRAMRGCAAVAHERLDGLLRAAALLGDRAEGAKLSGAAQVVGRAESQGPPSLAGQQHLQGRRRVAQRRDRQSSPPHPAAAWRGRQHPLEHECVAEERRRRRGTGAGPLRGAGARARLPVAGPGTARQTAGHGDERRRNGEVKLDPDRAKTRHAVDGAVQIERHLVDGNISRGGARLLLHQPGNHSSRGRDRD